MPHLKVNVNGKRYTISGINRGTCSKQILCALAKVDAELQTSKTLQEKYYSSDSVSDDQRGRVRHSHGSKKTSKREEKCTTCMKLARTTKGGEKRGNPRKARSVKRKIELDNKGIQTSNGMLETLGKTAECKKNCLPTQHKRDGLKAQVLEAGSQTLKEFNRNDVEANTLMDENKQTKCVDDQSKDTDHDTGISELHSDSSFETTQVLHYNEKANDKMPLNHENRTGVKCASTNTDPVEPANSPHSSMLGREQHSSVDDFIVAQLLGSETDVENDEECSCKCIYVDSDSEELQDEIGKIRDELKLTEAKLADQNKMIESLNALIKADQRNSKEEFNEDIFRGDVDDDYSKRIDELKQSIKLSNQLYDYQKLETQANALELERVESQIRRKRWHVESLLKELRSVKKNSLTKSGLEKPFYHRNEGTLV